MVPASRRQRLAGRDTGALRAEVEDAQRLQDADAAGDAATLRGLSVAREALDREAEIMFDPRGLVRTEGRPESRV